MFNKYEYVCAVYEEGSFTRAAQKLFISQPSLSVAIKNIERKIGAPLFERNGSNITPTQIGLEYIAAAKEIITVKENFQNKLDDIFSLSTGKLIVGGSNYISSYVLPKIITHFTAHYPGVEIELKEASSSIIRGLLKAGEADIIIDSFGKIPDDFEGYPLKDERILLCVPSSLSINERLEKARISPRDISSGAIDFDSVPTVQIRDFKNERFILLKDGNDMHARALDIFKRNRIDPEVAFCVDQLNTAYALLESQTGVGFVTDTFFKYSYPGDRVFLYKIDDKRCSRTLFAAYKKNKYCSIAMSEFLRSAQLIISAR